MGIYCGKCGGPIAMGYCPYCDRDRAPKGTSNEQGPKTRGPAGPSLTSFAEQHLLEHHPKPDSNTSSETKEGDVR